MAPTIAAADVTYVAMHWRAHSREMRRHASYDDVVEEVRSELLRRMDALTAAGVKSDRIVLDPGLGFAKEAAHDWALLRHLSRIIDIGQPVLVGASRKSFLGHAAARADGQIPPAHERDHLTAAVTALAAAAGAACVRVHDARSSREAVTVATAWRGLP